MQKILREYETVMIMNPDLGDDVTSAALQRVRELLGKLEAEMLLEDIWGKRKMSFEIERHGRGNYVSFQFAAPRGVIQELERTLNNMDEVLRFISVHNGDVTDLAARKAEVTKQAEETKNRRASGAALPEILAAQPAVEADFASAEA